METQAEIRQAVQDDLSAATNSTFYSPTLIDRTIGRVYMKVTSLWRWPQLQDALYTTTQSGINYYDAPDTWRPQSIWRLEINNERYGESPDGSPISFQDFLSWKEDNATSTKKRWAMQWRRFFVSPTPTSSSLELAVWGQKNAAALTVGVDAATTIFSENMPECNEAIALEVAAVLRLKGERPSDKQLLSQEANAIFLVAFNKWTKDTAKQEKTEPFLNVPDFFGRQNSSYNIGNFDVDLE